MFSEVLKTVGLLGLLLSVPSTLAHAAAAATVACLNKCPLWQLTLRYVDLFCFRQQDSDTKSTAPV